MKKQSSGYGQAGGVGQGQPYSRFQIEGDPTPYIPLWAAGSMITAVPAHMSGGEGGAYYYGSTKVGGITNMTSNGDVLRPIINVAGKAGLDGPFSLYLGGANFYDVIANAIPVSIFADGLTANSRINVNGELCRNATTNLVWGGAKETFTTAVTATTVNGSQTVTFSGSIAAATLPGYAYTPCKNAPQVGDLVEIQQAGIHYFHRLIGGSGSVWTMYPAYQGAGGAGLLANIHRTGFGSCSRVLHFFSGSSEVYYYVGNTRDVRAGFSATPTNYGTIECAVGGLSHFMAPVTTPAAAQVNAVDLAYYKGFLLYMAGGSISWSVAGFPTGGTAGFSTGDFPDLNTTVVDTQDVGLAFEFLGDQLIALFQNGAWLVQATGIVPEFNFYRLPEVPGIYAPVPAVASPDSVGIGPGGAGLAFGRHATRSAGSVFYLSEQGLAVIEGSPPHKIISEAVDNYDFPSETMPNRASSYWLSWDQGSDSLIWRDSSDGRGLMRRNGNWAQLDQTAIGAIRATTAADATGYLTASGTFGRGVAYRPMGVMYWNPSDQKVYHVGQLDAETTNTSAIPWIWASQIQSLGQVYNGFRVGGFEIWCRAAAGVTTANLQWSIYGGSDPYHLNLRQGPTTFNYAAGLVDGRAKLGNTLDDAFVGLVLTGSQWIELAGAVIYPSDSEAV